MGKEEKKAQTIKIISEGLDKFSQPSVKSMVIEEQDGRCGCQGDCGCESVCSCGR